MKITGLKTFVANAARHASTVEVCGRHADGHLTVTVDDDGPGIPLGEREAVFKPFYRLDNARNLDETLAGTREVTYRDRGLAKGLIAAAPQDSIARGGDIDVIAP